MNFHTIMNFDNITEEQSVTIFDAIKHHINEMKNDLLNKGIDLSMIQLHKTINQYFKLLPDINEYEFISNCVNIYCAQHKTECFIKAIQKTIDGHNVAGHMLTHIDNRDIIVQDINRAIAWSNYIIINKQISHQAIVNYLFLHGYQNIVVKQVANMHLKQNVQKQKLSKYMLQFLNKSQHHTIDFSIVNTQIFNKIEVHQQCKILKQKAKQSFREKAIIQLYNKQDLAIQLSHNTYQLIQYLLTISDTQFEKQFNVTNTKDISILSKMVNEQNISTLTNRKMKADIVKHVEQSQIELTISNQFRIDDISDDFIIKILDNIENRIQIVSGTYLIIIRRVSDNKILKSKATDDNIQYIENILKQCHDGNLYDIILLSQQKYKNIAQIRIRSLQYFYSYYDKMEILLKYPKDLISVVLFQAKIINMNQCINLRNFYTIMNVYTKQDIAPLNNLKRIYSFRDTYINSENSMIYDLFQNNKLEYCQLIHNDPNSNIVGPFTLSKNIENLRFFYIEQGNASYEIKLDISGQVPVNLSLFEVKLTNYGKQTYGILQGPSQKVAEIEKRLINQIKKNK